MHALDTLHKRPPDLVAFVWVGVVWAQGFRLRHSIDMLFLGWPTDDVKGEVNCQGCLVVGGCNSQ